jgi:hypothetical protein
MTQRRSYTLDAELIMKDAGLVAADAAATVSGSAKTLNVGEAAFKGVLVVDVTAIEIASNDELYRRVRRPRTSRRPRSSRTSRWAPPRFAPAEPSTAPPAATNSGSTTARTT